MRPMVLADRHHADLYWSLQRLFEDRLGMELWTPVGQDWWDAGYWRFGEGFGDDRLAQQFLGTGMWSPAVGGTWVTRDSHHPERVIHGIDLDVARVTRWDYVVATVDDNQTGLAAFAGEVGATYVRQVGNVNSFVDWSLRPVVLQSAAGHLPSGVAYHQEIDEGVFRWVPPTGSGVVRSFVNCFGSTPCLEDFVGVERHSDLTFERYGIDEPAGNVEPVSRIADLMAGAGWGWHDKVQGDGFGHVIHDWAAIGRPLIGHASHYRGLMAEPFWEDGVTCIDLNRHSLAETAELLTVISADPARHLAMCEAIRAKYDALVDYDAEAKAIGDLLTRQAVAV